MALSKIVRHLLLVYGPALIEHCLIGVGFHKGAKVTDNFDIDQGILQHQSQSLNYQYTAKCCRCCCSLYHLLIRMWNACNLIDLSRIHIALGEAEKIMASCAEKCQVCLSLFIIISTFTDCADIRIK